MIIILGMPGAGKTTQTSLLAKYLNCPWFSMGRLIRQYATGEVRQQMLQGKIIADEPTIDILTKALAPIDTASEECIVEGNPRSVGQAQWWLKKINDGQIKLTGIIHLTLEPEVTNQRLLKRGRVDDTPEVIEKRFNEYKRTIVPTLDYLKEQGMTIHEVEANATEAEVATRIQAALGLER